MLITICSLAFFCGVRDPIIIDRVVKAVLAMLGLA